MKDEDLRKKRKGGFKKPRIELSPPFQFKGQAENNKGGRAEWKCNSCTRNHYGKNCLGAEGLLQV